MIHPNKLVNRFAKNPFVLLSLILLAPCNTWAAGTVYQVEMIVFERGARNYDSDAETWGRNVAPAYPANWQRLIDPAEQAAEKAREEQESSIRLSDDFLQTLAEERSATEERATTDEASAPQGDIPSAADSQAGLSTDNQPAFLEYLPESARTLQKTHDALVRRNQYRILFHETWLQPLEAPEKAPALILHGGKKYGDRYELQGYITLGVSRFLHVQTDLWFSEFSINQGEDLSHGLSLPPEPQNSLPADTNINPATQYDATDSEMVNLTNRLDSGWGYSSMEQPEGVERSPYLVNEIVTLRQKRRMRSGELHYLDNPRLGVLIKFTAQ